MSAGNQAFGSREIMDIKAAANYLGVSRSHLSHILAGKVAGVPAIPHVRAGRRAKGSLQLRKHADRRVWVVLYYDEKSERRYHTLGWASEMNKGQADEKRQEFMREINGGARTIGAILRRP